MSIESIKQDIEQNNESVSEKIADLEVDRAKLVNILKPFIKDMLKSIVESEVKNSPEHTKELGAQKLGEMKKQLADLLNQSDLLVTNTFASNDRWVHINYIVHLSGDTWGQKSNNKKKAENCINAGIKAVLGNAGKILIDNGYAKAGSQYETTAKWQMNDKSEIVFGSHHGYHMPRDIEEMIKSYCEKIESLHDDVEKIERLKKKLSEQEAADLWEQA